MLRSLQEGIVRPLTDGSCSVTRVRATAGRIYPVSIVAKMKSAYDAAGLSRNTISLG